MKRRKNIQQLCFSWYLFRFCFLTFKQQPNLVWYKYTSVYINEINLKKTNERRENIQQLCISWTFFDFVFKQLNQISGVVICFCVYQWNKSIKRNTKQMKNTMLCWNVKKNHNIFFVICVVWFELCLSLNFCFVYSIWITVIQSMWELILSHFYFCLICIQFDSVFVFNPSIWSLQFVMSL